MVPLNKKIQIEIPDVNIGVLKSDAVAEKGTIIAFGKDVNIKNSPLAIGSDIYFKAWAVDIITDGDKKYYFIEADSEGLCAVE